MKKILITSLIVTFIFFLFEKKILRESLIFLGDKIIPIKYYLFKETDLEKKEYFTKEKKM